MSSHQDNFEDASSLVRFSEDDAAHGYSDEPPGVGDEVADEGDGDGDKTDEDKEEEDQTGDNAYEHNKYNIRQEAETLVKRAAIANHPLGESGLAQRKSVPRTLEACNRCKARKMRCSTDPNQCRPCKNAKETCYHAHPITGKAYERGWEINEYATKLREIERQSNEIERLRELVNVLEDRLISQHGDNEIRQEREKRTQEMNEQQNAEGEQQKMREEEFDELVKKEMEWEQLKLEKAKARKVTKLEAEEKQGIQAKVKIEKGQNEKNRRLEQKPIAKAPAQTNQNPTHSEEDSDSDLYSDTLNRPSKRRGPAQSTSSTFTPVPPRTGQFPSSNRSDYVADPSLTTPRPTRQPTQARGGRGPPRPQQPARMPPPQPRPQQPPPQQPSEINEEPLNISQPFEEIYSSSEGSIDQDRPFDDVAKLLNPEQGFDWNQ
ncbi:hypothetical protein ACJ72_03034 [Emergomyces africanus]|uniref:Zn(2)-C6 fungal-type domain-containing protein n=1 Tax=Emergomyces africanus TaxID=1955775 RepID=A0A1B7P0R0_9EURO|nr:hypothetical protein ACJ72_03034 [Emergomyces africanus]